MRSLTSVLNAVVWRLILLLSRKTAVEGLLVGQFTQTSQTAELELSKVKDAISLLATYDPVRFARMKRDLRCVMIVTTAGNLAEYDHGLRVCNLDPSYLAAPEVTPALVAASIAHEATHARLWAAGFRYPPALRERIEKLCFEAEIAFGRRLPDGRAVIAHAERQLARDPKVWTDEERRARAFGALRKLGTPEWLLRWFGADKPAA